MGDRTETGWIEGEIEGEPDAAKSMASGLSIRLMTTTRGFQSVRPTVILSITAGCVSLFLLSLPQCYGWQRTDGGWPIEDD